MNVNVKKFLWRSLIGVSHVICQLGTIILWFLVVIVVNVLLQTGDIRLDDNKLPVNPDDYWRFFSFIAFFLGSIFFIGRVSERTSRLFSDVRKGFDELYKK